MIQKEKQRRNICVILSLPLFLLLCACINMLFYPLSRCRYAKAKKSSHLVAGQKGLGEFGCFVYFPKVSSFSLNTRVISSKTSTNNIHHPFPFAVFFFHFPTFHSLLCMLCCFCFFFHLLVSLSVRKNYCCLRFIGLSFTF